MAVRIVFLHNNNGYTYLLVLLAVMLMGIMQGVVGQSWKSIMQREREEELLFRECRSRMPSPAGISRRPALNSMWPPR